MGLITDANKYKENINLSYNCQKNGNLKTHINGGK